MNQLPAAPPLRLPRLLSLFALMLIAVGGCRTTLDEPLYHSDLKSDGVDMFIVSIDSDAGMSEDAMRRALLTEAAHGAIDHGGSYLRVEDLSMDQKNTTEKRSSTTAAPPPAAPVGGDASNLNQQNPSTDPSYTTDVTFTHHRTGRLRFLILHDQPAPARGVYDASKLLDELKQGRIPPMT